MNCEFYSETSNPKCKFGFYGGNPTKQNCVSCIKNGRNNKQFVEAINLQRKEGITGFGDILYKMADPIAIAIDNSFGTSIQGCGGCKKRREKLNEMFPFKNKK